MNPEAVSKQLQAALTELGVDESDFEGLASSLIWRIGRLSDDAPVTVRLGTTSGLERFAELPRLRNATDQELEEALADGSLQVEWVGSKP